MRRGLLRAVAALALCLGGFGAAAERPITLPPGDLGDLLTRLALDNGIDLLFASDLVRGRHSPGARNAAGLADALRQILAGTGLDYTQGGERSITIVPLAAPAPAPHAEIRPRALPEITVSDSRLAADLSDRDGAARDDIAERVTLGAAALSRHPDGTIADALARMTGISVALSSIDPNLGGLDTVARGEGQFVSVRGLDSQYDVSLINGVNIAQGMPYSRQVELGLMPPFGLDRVDIIKVSGADRDGDAVGGTVDFRTPTAFDQEAPFTRFSARGQIDQRAFDYRQDAGGGAAQLETARRFGPGDRFGIYAGVYYDHHNFVSSEQDIQVGQWGYRLTATPGLGANPPAYAPQNNLLLLSVNPQFTKGDVERYGGSLSLDWHGDDSQAWFRSTYGYGYTQQDVFQRGFQGAQYAVGLPQGNGLFLTQAADAQEHYWYETNPELAELTTNTLGGISDFGRWRLDYDLFYSWGQNSRPDHIESSWGIEAAPATYIPGLGGPLTLSYRGSSAYPVPVLTAAELAALGDFSRFMVHNQGELNVMESDQHKAGGAFDARYDLDEGSFLKGGVKLTASRRFTYDRDYLIPIVPQGTLLSNSGLIETVLPQVIPGVYDYPIPLFDGDRIRQLILSAPRPVLTPDEYNQSTMWGWETVGAVYGLVHFRWGAVNLEAGLRFEHSAIDNHYWAVGGTGTLSGWASSTTSYDKALPSLLLDWRPDGAGTYRAALWSSYARPAFYQLGGGTTTQLGSSGSVVITEGNPHLKSTDAVNLDLSGDWDWGPAGQLTLAGFYKALSHYMYNQGSVYLDTQSEAEGAATTIVSPHNGGAAHIAGLELTASKRFGPIGLQLNGTVQHSLAHLDNPALGNGQPMQNAPGLLGNATLSYEGDGVQAALAYHYAGDYVEQYGLWGGLYNDGALDKWIQAAQSLDLSFGGQLAEGFEMGAQIHNLLNDVTYHSTIGRHNDAVPQIIEAGRVFLMTTSYRF